MYSISDPSWPRADGRIAGGEEQEERAVWASVLLRSLFLLCDLDL
jgi:hypothetical protein